jgi:hypothetical protein
VWQQAAAHVKTINLFEVGVGLNGGEVQDLIKEGVEAGGLRVIEN